MLLDILFISCAALVAKRALNFSTDLGHYRGVSFTNSLFLICLEWY